MSNNLLLIAILRNFYKANFLNTFSTMYLTILFSVIAVVLLMSPDSIINKDTENKMLKMVYDNAMILGMVSGGLAVYFYMKPEKGGSEETSKLPTYDEATSDE
jgi:nucleoside recognition membrane protein YjiH